MLLPIGRDDAVVRRMPWICWGITAVNVLLFVMTFGATRATEKAVHQKASEMIRFLAQRPYLQIPERLATLLPPEIPERLRAMAHEVPLPPDDEVAEEQQRIDRLDSQLDGILEEWPLAKWGYKPSRGGALTLLTSMFLHSGFMHLLGNMLFLFATGPFIEDVYGRVLFPVLYFVGGIFATLSWAYMHHGSLIPLVGASGAIAAVMGAYLIRFYKSKIEFLWLPLVIPVFRVRFFMPAFIVLPLWFAMQMYFASAETVDSGVAFSAHIGGFVFGLVAGILMKLTSLEERWVNPAVEAQTTWKEDPELVRAFTARDAGDLARARTAVEAALKNDPSNVTALATAADLGWTMQDWEYASRHATRLVSEYVKSEEHDLARNVVDEVLGSWSDVADPRFFVRAAGFAEKWGDEHLAMRLRITAVSRDDHGTVAIPALITIARTLKKRGDSQGAREALEKALRRPALSETWRDAIANELSTLDDLPWS